MKILTEQETQALEFKIPGGGFGTRRSKNESFLSAVEQLEEGQNLFVAKSEWVGKGTPTTLLTGKAIRKRLNGRRFHAFALKDESGWIVAPRKEKAK